MNERERIMMGRWWTKIEKNYEENGDAWGPFGDKNLLEEVCKEIQQFSGDSHWTRERKAEAVAIINKIARDFILQVWEKSIKRPVPKGELRKKLEDIDEATVHLHDVMIRNFVQIIELIPMPEMIKTMYGIRQIRYAVATTLRTHEFTRRGRAKSELNAHVVLVLHTRSLMASFAGRLPGFGRKTDHSSSPLVRTVHAIYHYATGESVDDAGESFGQYIAHAERFSKNGSRRGKLGTKT